MAELDNEFEKLKLKNEELEKRGGSTKRAPKKIHYACAKQEILRE